MALLGRDGGEGKTSGFSRASCSTKKIRSFKALVRNSAYPAWMPLQNPREPLVGLEGPGQFCLSLYLLIFWLDCVTCGILVPRPSLKPRSSLVRIQSPNHWAGCQGISPG